MKIVTPYSFQTEEALRVIGASIRAARLRRGESETLASQRAGVSRNTWARLEQGKPSIAAGLLIEALIVYGFERQVFELGNPDLDEMGKLLDRVRRPKRGNARGEVRR